jgi:hypothetical protein
VIKGNSPQDSSSEENEEELEWHHKLPSDTAAVHNLVSEQSGPNKSTAPSVSENPQFLIYLCCIFRPLYQLLYK